jgi:chemotaxis protein methyltransferase CheR
MSVATLQQQLQVSGTDAAVELGPYMTRLCATLAASLIGERRPISLQVRIREGTVSSSDAVTLGLLVTELVINALKHGFPGDRGGVVDVTYDCVGPNWKLAVSDNGIGAPDGGLIKTQQGLGTSILKALALQLDARLSVSTNSTGTSVSLVHGPPGAGVLPAARARLAIPSLSQFIRENHAIATARDHGHAGAFE